MKEPGGKAVCASLLFLTLLVFWPVVTNGFVNFDDGVNTFDLLREHHALGWRGLRWAFTTVHCDQWMPLTLASHMIDLRLFGLRPWGHHLTNLVIHAANVLILFLTLRRMTRDAWRSAFVAAVFAVHPLQVESVAWISERKNLLSTFFLLIALWNYASYARRTSHARYGLSLLAFSAALMSKASAVTLPCLMILLDYWPLARLRLGWRRLLAEKIPFLALSLAAGCSTVFGADKTPLSEMPFGLRFGNAVLSAGAYLRKTVWPADLSVFYPHPSAVNLWASLILSSGFAAATVIAVRFRRERPSLLIGWLWFCVALAPMIGLIQVGKQGMADRYAYVPLIGLAVAAAWAIPIRPGRERASILPAGLLIGALMTVAARQVLVWRDSVSLFEHALTLDESNALAHVNLGGALLARGETALAAAHYRRALDIDPNDAETHNDLGGILAQQGDLPRAAAQFELAARLATNAPLARMASDNLSKALSSMRPAGAAREN